MKPGGRRWWLRAGGGLILAAAGVGIAWRYASRRRSLPCPPWLAWGADNPVTDVLTGTRATLERIELSPGQRVLEVGAGWGRLAIPAARRVMPTGSVVALELQRRMVEKLQATVARAGVRNVEAVLGDAADPHFQPESFDVAYLCTALGEIPDRDAALRQCYSALKRGGRLSITEIFPDPHYQPRATVQRLAEAAGFRLSAFHGPWYFFTANFVKP